MRMLLELKLRKELLIHEKLIADLLCDQLVAHVVQLVLEEGTLRSLDVGPLDELKELPFLLEELIASMEAIHGLGEGHRID